MGKNGKENAAVKRFEIVLEGLKAGANISEICNRYQVSLTQYDKCRDKFLNNGFKIFDINNEQETQRLKSEIYKLKTIIGDLTTEFKKTNKNEAKEIRKSKRKE
ncbi:MAG: hypothetical protein ACPL3Q_04590 [Candidatus Ratteibacteria bacterium]